MCDDIKIIHVPGIGVVETCARCGGELSDPFFGGHRPGCVPQPLSVRSLELFLWAFSSAGRTSIRLDPRGPR